MRIIYAFLLLALILVEGYRAKVEEAMLEVSRVQVIMQARQLARQDSKLHGL